MNFTRLNNILNWSFRVGRLFDIPIDLHISLAFFLFAAMARCGLDFWHGLEYAALIVVSILLHELGHALLAKSRRLSGISIMLHGFGGFAVSRGFRTPMQALVISLAGPAVTFLVGLTCLGVGYAGSNAAPYGTEASLQFLIIHSLGTLNILMGVLNLIPSLPFDGGNALKAWLSRKRPDFAAMRLVAHWGLIFTPLLILGALYYDRSFVALFGFIGLVTSYLALRGSGGVRLREVTADRRERKENEERCRRQQERHQDYMADIEARLRERAERERLRKLFEEGPRDPDPRRDRRKP